LESRYFIKNKYINWYFNIITVARDRIISEYTENHHIIPKCLGGDNSKENLIKLTAREHFICHWLLTKMVKHNIHKVFYALNRMLNRGTQHQKRYLPKSSHIYELARLSFSRGIRGRAVDKSTRIKISNTKKGVKLTQKHKRKISEGNIGKKYTEELKKKISDSLTGRTLSDEHKCNISIKMKGLVRSIETKNKISKTRKGKSSGMAGKRHSLESKIKMSIAQRKYYNG